MKALFGFLAGAVAGAAAALLLAPEKGEVTRYKIRRMVNHHIDNAEEEIQDARMRANKAAREAIKEASSAVKNL